MRQSITEERAGVHKISALAWTRGRVIALARKICRRPMSMLIDSRSTGNYVLAQTYTKLGICIEEELMNEELQLADGSPGTTQGRVKLQIKRGKYKNVVWARVFPHMQKQVILGMPWFRDVRGKEREKTGTGKKLERTRFFPFPFLQILTSANLYCQLCAPISLSSDTCFLFCFFLRIALFFARL